MKSVLIYNNRTGIAEKLEPLLNKEGFRMLVTDNEQQLMLMLQADSIQLILLDVELNNQKWDKGIEQVAALRRVSRIPLIVISSQSADTAKIMASF